MLRQIFLWQTDPQTTDNPQSKSLLLSAENGNYLQICANVPIDIPSNKCKNSIENYRYLDGKALIFNIICYS